jgi:hypothetical protein
MAKRIEQRKLAIPIGIVCKRPGFRVHHGSGRVEPIEPHGYEHRLGTLASQPIKRTKASASAAPRSARPPSLLTPSVDHLFCPFGHLQARHDVVGNLDCFLDCLIGGSTRSQQAGQRMRDEVFPEGEFRRHGHILAL